MAGQNPGEIRIAGIGRILVAPANTPAPADFTKTWDASVWKDLGFTTQDGVKMVKKDKMDPVATWQSVSPVRLVHAQRYLSLKFSLVQINGDTLPFFFGSGAMDPNLSYAVSGLPAVTERALGIEFTDGPDITHRIVVPRGAVTETEDTVISRTGPVKLSVTFVALLGANGEIATWSMNKLSPAPATP